MCSNASGDHMVKPMLVYKSLNPHATKNVNSGDDSTGENEEVKHFKKRKERPRLSRIVGAIFPK